MWIVSLGKGSSERCIVFWDLVSDLSQQAVMCVSGKWKYSLTVILWCEGHHPELTQYPVAVFWKHIVQHLQYYWERLFNCNTTPQFTCRIHVEFDLKVELKLKMEYINIYSPSRHFEIREITKYMCGSSFLPQNKSMEKELRLFISQLLLFVAIPILYLTIWTLFISILRRKKTSEFNIYICYKYVI